MRIVWPDGHVTTFNAGWLHDRRFPEEKAVESIIPEDVELWETEMKDKIPQMQFDEILSDDKALCKWIDFLRIHGLVFIRDVPQELGQLTRLAERVAGYLHPTVFGWVW